MAALAHILSGADNIPGPSSLSYPVLNVGCLDVLLRLVVLHPSKVRE